MATKKSNDKQNEKVIAALSYLIFFLPLLTGKSEYTLFHANQAFNLFLAGVVLWVGGMVLTVVTLGLASVLLLPLNLGLLVLGVLGIINALNGEKKKLPLIGNISVVTLK